MDQSYIRLPSNSSMNIYPDNRTHSYVTKLPDEIHLTGRWEIGLNEIQKLPVGYYSSQSKLAEKITETCLVSKVHHDIVGRG